ncbi:MAG: peptide ABC transporter substrate-binding protein [Lachnospiraceae bacterium]
MKKNDRTENEKERENESVQRHGMEALMKVKKNMKRVLSVLLVVVMVLGLTACGNKGNGGNGTGKNDGKMNEDQVLNLRAATFGNNYDVQDMGWRWMMADCYEGLYRNVAGENGEEFILAGAESVDISDDQLVYTFHLRKEAKWSDGKPVTANDYVYGWQRLLDASKGYSYAPFIFNVVGAKEYYEGKGKAEDVKAIAKDDYTFEVSLKVADPTFEAKLVATPLYPTRKDVAEAAGDQWGKDWKLCVYNGPFCMTELVEDNKMVWEKNPEYWDAKNVKLDKANWFCIAEDSTSATMFDKGELDLIQTSGDYAIKYAKDVDASKLQENTSDYPGTQMLCFDFKGHSKSGLIENVNIRKAISLSIDREEMIEAVYGRYKPAYGLVAPAISYEGKTWREQVPDPLKAPYDEYAGDSKKLQELFQKGLDELGIKKDLSDITITLLSYGTTMENQTEREYIQQAIQQKLGIKVELNAVGDYALLETERDAENYDLLLTAWYSDYNDPLDFLNIFYTGVYDSYGYYSNKDYDAMIDSLTGESDVQKRLDIYKALEDKLVLEDCAIVPIYYATKQVFSHNWVKDLKTSSFGASQELYRTYIQGR